MEGITFGEVHSYRDLKLLLAKKEMGSPAVKTNEVDIPGADGKLDMTDFFGEPKYDNVTHKFDFITQEEREQFPLQFAVIKNAIHGKKVRIVLDDDPTFYYLGRCHVSGFKNEKGAGAVSVDCDCEPYKYKMDKTVVTKAVNGTEAIMLTNARKRAVPTITTTAAMTIAFGGGTWTNSAGTYTIPELELVEGANAVTVTGTGTVTFAWQEGEL